MTLPDEYALVDDEYETLKKQAPTVSDPLLALSRKALAARKRCKRCKENRPCDKHPTSRASLDSTVAAKRKREIERAVSHLPEKASRDEQMRALMAPLPRPPSDPSVHEKFLAYVRERDKPRKVDVVEHVNAGPSIPMGASVSWECHRCGVVNAPFIPQCHCKREQGHV